MDDWERNEIRMEECKTEPCWGYTPKVQFKGYEKKEEEKFKFVGFVKFEFPAGFPREEYLQHIVEEWKKRKDVIQTTKNGNTNSYSDYDTDGELLTILAADVPSDDERAHVDVNELD